MDQSALRIIRQNFGSRMPDLQEFADAVVRTGTYDADSVLGFIGGVVDLFLEVLWSQADKAYGAQEGTVRWGQLMNHFIESPEIAMFEGSEISAGLGSKSRGSMERMPQMQKSDIVDCAKHLGSCIEKMYWIQHLDCLVTCEGTDSVYFWNPMESVDAPKSIQTPQLRDVPDCFDEADRPLYTVLAVAWDGSQDLTALLSNRLLVVWRLRSRDKFAFRQHRVYRLHAQKKNEPRQSNREPKWEVCIKPVDPKNESLSLKSSSPMVPKRSEAGRGGSSGRKESVHATDCLEREEKQMRLQMHEDRDAKEVANQIDLWYNTQRKLWITTDQNGKLCFWELISIENTTEPGPFAPLHAGAAHKRLVTAYIEVGHRKFCSASLDRTVVLWDTTNLTPEMRIEDHTASVLDLAYLNSSYSMISVGCEKRVYVWSIDTTAFRGLTAKLSGHQANLLRVSSGNDQRGRAFFTLDEACTVIVWDVATLSSLQTINTSKQNPRHALCFSNLGRLCLAGRRFYFYEGNELMALTYMGATPSKEQLAKTKKPVAGSFKERAKPRWCGLNEIRGTFLSVTEAEVRVHARGDPSHSRVVFCLNEGEIVTSYAMMDSMHLAILGTSKGAIHFIKARSGCAVKVYEGRLEGDTWEPGANAPTGAGGGGAQMMAAEAETEANNSRAAPGGPNARRSGSSPGGASRPSRTSSLDIDSATGSPHASKVKNGNIIQQIATNSRGMAALMDSHIGGRTTDIAGPEGSSAGGDGATDNQAEEEELAQEFQEVRGVVNMGYSEQDARRALQQRRKLADAWREWYQDETAQQNFENADAEGQEKALEDVRSSNMNANVENAVEKLLSGAIVTTGVVEDQLLMHAPLRAMEAKEGEEDKTRPRRLSASHNAPTAEEIAKGLSRKIQCVLPCEEQKRIYVGTDEGQVLVHSCDSNFTIKRWLTQPGPNVCAVTCLDVLYENRSDGPWGLLLVGTQEGSAHLYGLPNLRLAGSINVGRVLPDVNAESGDLGLRYAKLLWMPADSAMSMQFPLAVMTIDRRSRFRFWGIRLHSQSGKLEELALLLDGGQLTELKEEVYNPYAEPGEDVMDVGPDAKEKKDSQKGGKDSKAYDAENQSKPPARITSVCTVKGQVVLPLKAVPGALPPGQKAAADGANDKQTPAISAAFAALAAAFASSGGSGAEGDGADSEAAKEREKDMKVKFEDKHASSDTEEEDDRAETLQFRKMRQKRRPRTPDAGLDIDRIPLPPQVASADGSNYIFFGDAVGRIWCMDAVGSIVAAHDERPPLTVLLDEDTGRPGGSKSRATRSGIRFNTGGTFLSTSNSSQNNRGSVLVADGLPAGAVGQGGKQGVPTPTPEALKVSTSWQAHDNLIVSLVSTSSPPSLVSTDTEKQVKVWSTSGELWGHFQMAGVEPGNTFLWPPPQVLAAQHALMTIAKGLCKKLGLRTSGVSQDNIAAKGHAGDRRTRRDKRKSQKALKDTANSSGSEKKAKDKKKPEKKVVVFGEETDPRKKYQAMMRKKKEASSEGEEAAPQFMTEPPPSDPFPSSVQTPASAGAASDSDTGAAAAPAAKPTAAKVLPAKKELVNTGGSSEAPAPETADENLFDDGDVNDPGGIGDDELGGRETPKAHTKAFSRQQMTKMVRNRGFSSGFQSYRTFMSKSQSAEGSVDITRRKGESLSQLDSQMSTFFGREASDFGISFITRKETDHWDRSTRGMGARSSSEGALLRFAQTAVQDATKCVFDDLGVDVSKTDMWQLRKPSFLARLDRREEVQHDFLSNPASSTAQAVAQMYGDDTKKGRSRISINKSKSASTLASTGKQLVKK
jgi:WD40 repeat protein